MKWSKIKGKKIKMCQSVINFSIELDEMKKEISAHYKL